MALVALAAFGWWWVQQPLKGPAGVQIEAPLELAVPSGSSSRAVARAVADAGVAVSPMALYAWFRVSGRGTEIKAGFYEIQPGATPASLLDKLVRGEQALRSVTLLEGWNSRETFAAIRASKDLTQDLEGLSPEAIMALIGLPGRHPEGQFFPDTYRVVRNAPASSVLKQAAQAMQQRLAEAWAQKSPRSVLKSPEDALVLASIIEKETGAEVDRAMIGGVFNNRLRIGMRLQTDPTVIYGLGERFDGDLRRIDLQTDTPYNSYTRAGLPPTPISMPGWNSLLAAVQPAETQALYFVARGDGSSHFSGSLGEHNSAVRRYILNR
ncbi:aminodeoxychorismate lyase [Hydrogenophaga crassostreae]|uniref:Endolytic murein transglycosylase n=2 Tax=Hydrogenophaga crassostreae TaxID=1763535 RepID=A0A163CGE9_9BURK|nr:endolytic transglycosylase MltG [Hydrogenophaga crassostreae]AOW15560.1 aminodeoxychorismate lyase [Hydrogenophaga crassostreae]OAD42038.1 aminodeoxychorismate lyase [Hydrogenophaga crassostreae]